MKDSLNNNFQEDQHHEEIEQTEILGGDSTIESVKVKKRTEISGSGNVEVTETTSYFIVRGERVSADQVIGQCEIETCSQWLTARTYRECLCTKILCPAHSQWDEKEQTYFCDECYSSLKWKRFWTALGRFIIAPFKRKNK